MWNHVNHMCAPQIHMMCYLCSHENLIIHLFWRIITKCVWRNSHETNTKPHVTVHHAHANHRIDLSLWNTRVSDWILCVPQATIWNLYRTTCGWFKIHNHMWSYIKLCDQVVSGVKIQNRIPHVNIYQAHVKTFALSENACARTDCTCDRRFYLWSWGTENSYVNDRRTFSPRDISCW